MSIEGLQHTLERIDEIRQRFEPTAAPADTAAAEGFEGVLNAALGNTQAGAASSVPADLNALIQEQASQQGMDANLLKAVIQTESNFKPNAQSSVGAQGLMQLMPGTASGLGVSNSFDPEQNIMGGTKYLKGLLGKYQSLPKALAAYNAGPGAVDRHNGVPPYAETQNYVKKVIQSYKAYQAQGGGA